jgi:hypothetical protein
LLALAAALATSVASAQAAGPDDATLARASSFLLTNRLTRTVTDDSELRAAMRRVGFVSACDALAATRREVGRRHIERFGRTAVAMIRRMIPAERLAGARFISFVQMPLATYRGRIENALERDGVFTAAQADMRATYLARLTAMPATDDPDANVIIPRADIARALSVSGPWNLDDPAQVGMACAEQLIPPDRRPTISGGGAVQ